MVELVIEDELQPARQDRFASFQSFTAMPGSFTKSVVHPHARHWTANGKRETPLLASSPLFSPQAGQAFS